MDAWKEVVLDKEGGKKEIEDIYIGKEVMDSVQEKKYLGDIVSRDGRNAKNILERKNNQMAQTMISSQH